MATTPIPTSSPEVLNSPSTPFGTNTNNIVTLQVGDRRFTTRTNTLTEESPVFSSLLSVSDLPIRYSQKNKHVDSSRKHRENGPTNNQTAPTSSTPIPPSSHTPSATSSAASCPSSTPPPRATITPSTPPSSNKPNTSRSPG